MHKRSSLRFGKAPRKNCWRLFHVLLPWLCTGCAYVLFFCFLSFLRCFNSFDWWVSSTWLGWLSADKKTSDDFLSFVSFTSQLSRACAVRPIAACCAPPLFLRRDFFFSSIWFSISTATFPSSSSSSSWSSHVQLVFLASRDWNRFQWCATTIES